MAQISFLMILVGISQVLGIATVVMVSVWSAYYHGGTKFNKDFVFNFHPIFMVVGFIFLYAESIMFYRVFVNIEKLYVKVAHALVHAGAFLFALFGLVTVVLHKEWRGMEHFQTLHSWLGLGCLLLFLFQWIAGFVTFLFPKLSESHRQNLMPLHRYFGFAIFGLAFVVCICGILEKAIFASQPAQSPQFGNALGIVMTLFVGLVTFIASYKSFKRPADDSVNVHAYQHGYDIPMN